MSNSIFAVEYRGFFILPRRQDFPPHAWYCVIQNARGEEIAQSGRWANRSHALEDAKQIIRELTLYEHNG